MTPPTENNIFVIHDSVGRNVEVWVKWRLHTRMQFRIPASAAYAPPGATISSLQGG